MFRTTGRFRLCANLYLANCFFVAILGCSLFTGGIHSMVLPWFALTPITSVLLLELGTDTILWTVLACLVVGGFGVSGMLGEDPTRLYNTRMIDFFNLACIVGLVLILSWIAFLFGNNRKSAMATIVDQKASLEQALSEIEHLAFYDALTQIPNRRLFGERLNQVLAETRRCGCHGALMFMDLDNFKQLNDSQGHEAGDLLLAEAAKRLASCIREADTVARFGGDEFAVILHGLNQAPAAAEANAARVAEKIASTLAEPYVLALRKQNGVDRIVRHQCSASIGVVLFRDDAASQKVLLDRADAAMYRAKAAGRNTIHFYRPDDLLSGTAEPYCESA